MPYDEALRRGPGSLVVSAVVVTYNRADLLGECLRALVVALERVPGATEVVVVDTGAQGGLETSLSGLREIGVIRSANVGFSGGVALGIARTSGDWVALLNDDVVVDSGALVAMLSAGRARPEIGSVAAQLRFAADPDTVNSAGITIDRLGIATDRLEGTRVDETDGENVEVFGASGGLGLYRRRMLDEIGGFDESFFAYLEDADVAWRAQMRGWRCVYCARAVARHHYSGSFAELIALKHFLLGRNRLRLLAKDAERRQLLRYGPAIVAFDLVWATFAALRDGTAAPLSGRIRGVRDWNSYRRRTRERAPVKLEPAVGLRGGARRTLRRMLARRR